MNHWEFFPYHNRHIKFQLADGTVQSGVLLDIARTKNQRLRSQYVFIPTNKMAEWQIADKHRNAETIEILEKNLIDIRDIVWAELMR